jgi:signal transduction histidine kinase
MPSFSPDPVLSPDREFRVANRARVRRILQAALIHDLKAPLNTATLVVDLMGRSLAKDDASDPEVQRKLLENIDEIRREIRRITEALPGLLSLADPGEEAARPFDLVAALEDVLDLLRQQLLLRGARLHRLLPREPLVVVGRPGELQHAVLNVVLNALEATPRGGEVSIRVERNGSGVRVRVADEGPGIAPELADRVFEPRVTGREGHEGLGLPVAREILREHGGTIRLLPHEEGGTVALIELPVASESVARAAKVSTTRDAAAAREAAEGQA